MWKSVIRGLSRRMLEKSAMKSQTCALYNYMGADGQIEVGGFTWVGVAFGISIRASLLLTTYCNSNMICPLS